MERLSGKRLQSHIDECNRRINKINEFASNNADADQEECTKNIAVLENAVNAVEEYKKYKILEEQGKLLKLPCAVGDTVYVIEVDEENFTHFHCPRKISEYKFNLQMLGLLEMFGKCIFLTREEAEAALKEL